MWSPHHNLEISGNKKGNWKQIGNKQRMKGDGKSTSRLMENALFGKQAQRFQDVDDNSP